MRIKLILVLLLYIPAFSAEITIDAAAGRKPISPYIYGKNNCLSDNPNQPLSFAQWTFLRDAGIRIVRECGGNNCTKYNWRLHLSSHPDWYNNVYAHDWDYAAESLDQNLPGVKGLWAFQLIGKAASSSAYNFDDWGYNGSQWWEGVRNNWAGGGGPIAGNGNPDLYLTDWPADSTIGILDNWFDESEMGLNKEWFDYWNMDNEPEIWNSTHDDVYPVQPLAAEFMLKYFEVAKKARSKFPEIKLVGPVAANEWQWYNWNDKKITYINKSYTWLEYFILRVAQEQIISGTRLLDVLDIHFYPTETNAQDIVQLHRVWFDKTYNYPGANGVKRAGVGDWDNNITREYIFERCRAWLEKHIGPDHNVKFSVTEMGIKGEDPNVTAVWYASTLGVFADNGVEIFTPWDWKTGMWEVIHLFSKNAKEIRITSSSNDETYVSAYSSINTAGDSVTVILVNREISSTKDANVTLSNFDIDGGNYTYLRLNGLPAGETFVSSGNNALSEGTVTVNNNSFSMSLPSLSVTTVLLTGQANVNSIESTKQKMSFTLQVYPNPLNPATTIAYTLPDAMNVCIQIFDNRGRYVQTLLDAPLKAGDHTHRFDGSHLSSGIYLIRISAGSQLLSRKIVLIK